MELLDDRTEVGKPATHGEESCSEAGGDVIRG